MTNTPFNVAMPVEKFLAHAGTYLRRGDVVLLRGKASLYSWAIRWWTQSEFSHAALVFSVPGRDDGFERAFLIEASIGGVDITDLEQYVREMSLVYDVAIKRCEQTWLTAEVQRAVRGHMLNYIKANYDYWTLWAIAKRLWRGRDAAVRDDHQTSRRPPTRFVCSGFVQYGYLRAVRRLIDERKLPAHTIDDVVFNPGMRSDASSSEILRTTPEDLAQTERLTWKYVITGRRVYAVERYDQVKRLFRRR